MIETTESLKAAAKSVEQYIIGVRRALHASPELGWKEDKTLETIKGYVHDIDPSGTTFVLHEGKGGVWYDYTVHPDGVFRLFRSDVDALPIAEETGLCFASTNGCMHACGHDMHPAMLLGAMKVIADGGIFANLNIRFVFQRAEENPVIKSGGATLVEDDGVLENVSNVHMLHVWPEKDYPPGTFGSRGGPMLANSDRVKVTIHCSGGHVAFPHQGSSATDIAADVSVGMRGFGERFFEPGEQYSFVNASIQSGEASNVRPGVATMWFAARNFRDEAGRTLFEHAVRKAITAIVLRYSDASVDVDYVRGHPALINDRNDVQHTGGLLQQAGLAVKELPMTSGGEDFAHYLQHCPGSAWVIGVHQDGTGPIHSPTFNPDESGMWYGVLFWLLLAYCPVRHP
jgi:amidohydrolase